MNTLYLPNEIKQYATWAIYNDSKQLISAISGFVINEREYDSFTTYQNAYNYMTSHSTRAKGLAFVLSQDYICIDVSLENQEIAQNFIYNFSTTYMEYSMNKKSIHILIRATFTGTTKLSLSQGIKVLTKGEYVCLTGEIVQPTPQPIDGTLQQAFDNAYNLYFKGIAKKENFVFTKNENSDSGLTLEIVNNRIGNSTASNKYYQLSSGHFQSAGFNDITDARIALLNILIFFTSGDEKLTKYMFRTTKLYDEYDFENESKGLLDKLYLESKKQQICVFDKSLDVIADYAFDNITCITKLFKSYPLNDTGNAQRLFDKFGDQLKYETLNKSFYLYNKALGIRIEDTSEYLNIKRLIDYIIDDIRVEMQSPRVRNDGLLLKEYTKNLTWLSNSKGKENAIKELKNFDKLWCSPNDFDSDNYLLNTLSGVLNLRNGQLVEHNKAFMMTKSTRCEVDIKNPPEKFLKFMWETCCGNKEMFAYLQTAIGYSLTGSTIEQCYFPLYGLGNNGKSVFLDTMTNMLGDYAVVVSIDTFTEKMYSNSSNATPDIARLKGARFVTSGEPRESAVLDETLMKSITGGERMIARRLHKDFFEFYPQCKIWISCNNMLKIKGTTRGDWRRIKKIDFNNNVEESKIDKNLTEKLKAELPQILGYYALQGCIEWQANGLQEPDYIKKSVEEFRYESNSILNYASQFLIEDPTSQISSGDIFVSYMKWARSVNENTSFTQTKFGLELKKAINLLYPTAIKLRGKSGKVVFKGVDFKNTPYTFSKDLIEEEENENNNRG